MQVGDKYLYKYSGSHVPQARTTGIIVEITRIWADDRSMIEVRFPANHTRLVLTKNLSPLDPTIKCWQ